MLMMARVPLALVAATTTRIRASFEECLDRMPLPCGLATDDATRRFAHVSAIEVEPDANDEVGDVLFGKARVRACRARLSAGMARVDAAREPLLHLGRRRMRSKHFVRLHSGLLFFALC